MKGRSWGKNLKTKSVHGVQSGNHSNPHVLKQRQDGGRVEGDAPRARLDRPMRKCGGSVKSRADGGMTISEDSKAYAAKQRSKAGLDRFTRNVNIGGAALLGTLGSVGNKFQRKGNWPLAGVNAASAMAFHKSAKDADAEADRVERGQATPGEEDRKHGGKVK